MKPTSSWKKEAVCASDKHSARWISYKESDVEYAKDGCSRCPVKKMCLANALANDYFVGTIAGLSEYDFLKYTWQAVWDINESNWRTDDTVFQRLLQETE